MDMGLSLWIWGRSKEVQELRSSDLHVACEPSETCACSSLRWGRGRLKPAIANDGGGDDHAGCRCLDRGRGPDRPDVGGRVGVGGRRRCHCRAARQPGPRRLARRRSAFTHHRGPRSARNRRSVPLAGADGAGRGVRRRSLWTSATFPPGTITVSRCGRTTSSASSPAGSTSWRCRSIADVR